MNAYFLRKKLDSGKALEGKVSGVAYTGALIKNFGFIENFIVDTSTLEISKERIALLKDHMSEKVIGHVMATIEDNAVLIDGIISKKIKESQDIISLSEDGFSWELSVGVYDGYIEENFSGEVNGIEVESANVLRNGVLREVSIVALGADSNTNINILNQKSSNKENLMDTRLKKRLMKALKLDVSAEVEEAIVKVEEIAEEVAEHAEEVAEVKAEVDEKDALIKSLQERIKELELALDAINEEAEEEDRAEEIEASIKSKGITLSREKIKIIAKSKESTDLFLETIAEMKVSKKIPAELCGKTEFGKEVDKNSKNLREQANELVKNGKAKDFLSAINILTGEK